MSHTSLPDGCQHIAWEWTNPDGDPADSSRGDLRGQLLTLFATWTCSPGEEPEELPLRRQEIAAQGLAMVGDPHLCQVDNQTGRELWAVPLAPDPI